MSGRVRRADAEVRKTEILETTIRVVLERGFGNTRVSDVAAALGVSTGLIHYHFSSKGELLAEALRFAADADIARVGKVLAGGSNALERLDRALRDYVPGGSGEEVWVLWIDAWGHALTRSGAAGDLRRARSGVGQPVRTDHRRRRHGVALHLRRPRRSRVATRRTARRPRVARHGAPAIHEPRRHAGARPDRGLPRTRPPTRCAALRSSFARCGLG